MANIFEDELDNSNTSRYSQSINPNSVYLVDRPNTRQKKRKIARSKKRKSWASSLPNGRAELAVMTGFIFFIAFLMLNVIGPWKMVNNLRVVGNTYVSENLILSAAKIRSIDYFNQVVKNRQEIEKRIIESNPLVSDIVFERPSQWSTVIRVNEQKVVGIIEENGSQSPLIGNGKILYTYAIAQGVERVPLIKDNGQKGKLVDLAASLRQFSPDLLARVSQVEVANDVNKPQLVYLVMEDGMIVQGHMPTLAEKMERYDQMMEIVGNQRGTLNLEVGAYFTPQVNLNNSVKLDVN